GAGGSGSMPAGPIPAVLNRPLHFPALRPGQRCPASPGKPVNTAGFGGVALGSGPVRVLVGGTGGDLRHGIADLINTTSSPPWLGLKTLWFSLPRYQGPFVIRAHRLRPPRPGAPRGGPALPPPGGPPPPPLQRTAGTGPTPARR